MTVWIAARLLIRLPGEYLVPKKHNNLNMHFRCNMCQTYLKLMFSQNSLYTCIYYFINYWCIVFILVIKMLFEKNGSADDENREADFANSIKIYEQKIYNKVKKIVALKFSVVSEIKIKQCLGQFYLSRWRCRLWALPICQSLRGFHFGVSDRSRAFSKVGPFVIS